MIGPLFFHPCTLMSVSFNRHFLSNQPFPSSRIANFFSSHNSYHSKPSLHPKFIFHPHKMLHPIFIFHPNLIYFIQYIWCGNGSIHKTPYNQNLPSKLTGIIQFTLQKNLEIRSYFDCIEILYGSFFHWHKHI